MTTATALFLTASDVRIGDKVYNYDDLLHTGENVIEYTSQKVRRTYDDLLKDPMNHIYVFGRANTKHPFRFLGKVVTRAVMQERTDDVPLRMIFTLDRMNSDICYPNQVFAPMPFAGMGKYKLGVLHTLPVIPMKGNAVNEGIVPVRFAW